MSSNIDIWLVSLWNVLKFAKMSITIDRWTYSQLASAFAVAKMIKVKKQDHNIDKLELLLCYDVGQILPQTVGKDRAENTN